MALSVGMEVGRTEEGHLEIRACSWFQVKSWGPPEPARTILLFGSSCGNPTEAAILLHAFEHDLPEESEFCVSEIASKA